MLFKQLNWAAIGPTVLFVLLWSAGAIFSKWGLEHASAFAFLLLRFALACVALGLLAVYRRRWLPQPGSFRQVALVGVLMTGGYTIFYLLSLDAGLTPGVLATVLGVQPILTLMLLERRASVLRVACGWAVAGVGRSDAGGARQPPSGALLDAGHWSVVGGAAVHHGGFDLSEGYSAVAYGCIAVAVRRGFADVRFGCALSAVRGGVVCWLCCTAALHGRVDFSRCDPAFVSADSDGQFG